MQRKRQIHVKTIHNVTLCKMLRLCVNILAEMQRNETVVVNEHLCDMNNVSMFGPLCRTPRVKPTAPC